MCRRSEPHTHTHQPARPHTTTRPHPLLVCSAELRAQLATKDEQLATKDEQINALTKQVGKLNVKPEDTVVGLWTSKDKQTVRKVFRGPKGGIYTQTAAGTKISPEEWAEMDEAEAGRRIAAHEEWKAASPTK